MNLTPFAKDNFAQLRNLLQSLVANGELGVAPNPNEWLSFHDQVARKTRFALMLLNDAIGSIEGDEQ